MDARRWIAAIALVLLVQAAPRPVRAESADEKLARLEQKIDRLEKILMQVYGARLRAEAPFRDNAELVAATERAEKALGVPGIIEALAGNNSSRTEIIARLYDAASAAAKRGESPSDAATVFAFLLDNKAFMNEPARNAVPGWNPDAGDTLGALIFRTLALGSQKARTPARHMAWPPDQGSAPPESWTVPVFEKGLQDPVCFEWALECADVYPAVKVHPILTKLRAGPGWELRKLLVRVKVLALLERSGDAEVRKDLLAAADAILATDVEGAQIAQALTPALHSGMHELIPSFIKMAEEQGKGRWGWNYVALQSLLKVVDLGPDAEEAKGGQQAMWNPELRSKKLKQIREWYDGSKGKLKWNPETKKFAGPAHGAVGVPDEKF